MQATSGSEGSWAGGGGGRVFLYSRATSLASALEICPDLIASPSCSKLLSNSASGKGPTDLIASLTCRENSASRAVGCKKGLGGEGATGAVSLGGEGPTGAVGCGREGATLGGEGSTDTVGCGEREGSVNVLSRLATAAPWTATRCHMLSREGTVRGREGNSTDRVGCSGGWRCRVGGTLVKWAV